MNAPAPGAVSAPSLPSLATPCPKCGCEAEHHGLAWVPSLGDPLTDRPPLLLPYDEAREHMRVQCERCGYVWPAAPNDADGAGSA